MNRPPHPAFAPLWREAGTPAAVMNALRHGESAANGLAADPLAPLLDSRSIAWAFDPPGGDDSIARAIARVRAGSPAAPDPALVSRFTPALQPNGIAQPFSASAIDRTALPASASPGSPNETKATSDAVSLVGLHRGGEPVFTDMATRAAHRPFGTAAGTIAARRAIEAMLDGQRLPTRALVAAIEPTAEPRVAGPAITSPLGQFGDRDRTLRAIAPRLARIDAMRRDADALAFASTVRREPTLASSPTSTPGLAMTPEPGISGFRRLAALFARPEVGHQNFLAEVDNPAAKPAPTFDVALPASPLSPRRSAPLAEPSRIDTAQDVPAHIVQRVGGDVSGDAEMAARLARILRREARRQGVADEGDVG